MVGCAIMIKKKHTQNVMTIFMICATVLVVVKHFMNCSKGRTTRKKKVAVIRPFSPKKILSADGLRESFQSWDLFPPCDQESNLQIDVTYDLILSYSQTYHASKEADKFTLSIIEGFHTFQWSNCFNRIERIEVNIPANRDLYTPSKTDDPLWVNGPNQQFRQNMKIVRGLDKDYPHMNYDYALILESDVVAIKANWLDDFVDEANEKNFSILGSKYEGRAWNGFRKSLPIALQHHINGNAMYNLQHPMTSFLFDQLEQERNSVFNAIPYDYRISQILTQGFLGIEAQLPLDVIAADERKYYSNLNRNATRKFKKAWDMYATKDGNNVVRQSKIIQNLVGSPLLPRDRRNINSSLIHGAKLYSDWHSNPNKITLLVSEWHDEISLNLVKDINESDHPFADVKIVVPKDLAWQSSNNVHRLKMDIPITIERRKIKSHGVDLCNVEIQNDWVMITNSYHTLQRHVDLAFNTKGKFVIPISRPKLNDCMSNISCKRTFEVVKNVFGENELQLVSNDDVVFRTEYLHEFCDHLNNESIDRVQINEIDTASLYLSYLRSSDLLEEYYEVVGMPGFHNFQLLVDHSDITSGESLLSRRLLTQNEENFAFDNFPQSGRDPIQISKHLLNAPSLISARGIEPQSSPTFHTKERTFHQASLSMQPTLTMIPSMSPSMSAKPSMTSQPSHQPSTSMKPSVSNEPSFTPTQQTSTKPSTTKSPSSLPSVSHAPSLTSSPSSIPSVDNEETKSSISPSVSSSPSEIPSVSMSPSVSVLPSSLPSVSHAPSLTSSPSSIPSVDNEETKSSISPSVSSSPSEIPSEIPSVSMSPSVSVLPSSLPSVSHAPSLTSSPSSIPSVDTEETSSISPSVSSSPSEIPSVSMSPSVSVLPSSLPSVSHAPSLTSSPSSIPSVDTESTSSISPSVSSSPSDTPSVSMSPSVSVLPSSFSSVVTESSSPSEIPSVSMSPSVSALPSLIVEASLEPSYLPSESIFPTIDNANGPSLSSMPSLSNFPSSTMVGGGTSSPSTFPSLSVQPTTKGLNSFAPPSSPVPTSTTKQPSEEPSLYKTPTTAENSPTQVITSSASKNGKWLTTVLLIFIFPML